MLSYIEVAFAWLLFISMPLVAAGMFYRARKHLAMREEMESAHGANRSQNEAARLQLYSAVTNLACGIALCAVVASIVLFGLSFAIWSGIAALIVWTYFFASMRLDRHRAKLISS